MWSPFRPLCSAFWLLSPDPMPSLTIDGKEVSVPDGASILEAAKSVGIAIPHYCYHPAFSIAGCCRLCVVEVEKMAKLQISCHVKAAEGVIVHTNTEKVLRARASVLEFLLLNHPLDCPVCDQAGECWLQIYYMEHGLYQSRLLENKIRKHKVLPIGRWVVLDSERCILCSRCVRFCREVSRSEEMGIFERGDRSEIAIFPGKGLFNDYSGNLVDICPVGALTDRDFRFQCRVWYLEKADSICPLCSRGCNIEIHYNLRRLHQSKGRRILRLKPRFNPGVNQWWMCDEGRYGYRFIDDSSRLRQPQMKEQGGLCSAPWRETVAAVAKTLLSFRPDEIAVLASPQLTNEELFLVGRVFYDGLKLGNLDFRVPAGGQPSSDDLLVNADKNPNTRGAEEIGFPPPGSLSTEGILAGAANGSVKALFIFHHNLFNSPWDPKLIDRALSKLQLLVFQGSNANRTSESAHFLLPSATFAEKEGTFTNFQGRVQKISQAVEPLGESLPDWVILLNLAQALGFSLPYSSPEEVFQGLSSSISAFSGLDYRRIGSQGALLKSLEGSIAG